MGDLTDRGPDGLGAIALVRRLRSQAAAAGGQVDALLGNHDAFLVAARRLGNRVPASKGATFAELRLGVGGRRADLDGLTDADATWLAARPAMLRWGDRLAMHADCLLYLRYGDDVAAVNTAFRAVLEGDDIQAWDRFLDGFDDHGAFWGPDGQAQADLVLQTYGGGGLVHGHTPISKLIETPPESIAGALIYAGGAAVNVDGGVYLGGPAIVWRSADGDLSAV